MYDINPFVFNAPVRGWQFINREELIEKILKITVKSTTQGSIWITGERQVGKTSLLRFIENEYEDIFEPITVDGGKYRAKPSFVYANVQDCESIENFYGCLRQALKNYFDFKIEKTDDNYLNFIKSLEYLYKEKYFIIFLIDEFDAFVQTLAAQSKEKAINLFSRLNRLIEGVSEIKGTPKIFCCVFSSNSTLNELITESDIKRRGSGLNVLVAELSWFGKDEITKLINGYLEGNTVSFSDKEIDICFKITRGYPYFFQHFLYIMYDEKVKNKMTITADIIKSTKKNMVKFLKKQ